MFPGHVIAAMCLDFMDDNDQDHHNHENNDFDDFVTEMFLGHVASLHSLGGDGFASQFEQVVEKTIMGEINRNEKKQMNKCD